MAAGLITPPGAPRTGYPWSKGQFVSHYMVKNFFWFLLKTVN